MDVKIQKVLANQGLASRREIERWIEAGRIKINGQVATLGARISATDKIHVDGKLIQTERATTRTRVLLFHKPVDMVCSRQDPEGRPTVFDDLPRLHHARWIAVGRLDINSSGLLLFTNNGELANRLMHPRYEVEREYAVRVLGDVTEETLQQLQQGVELDDGLAKFTRVEFSGGTGANRWYHVSLKEGRNREVRRMFEAMGHQVSRLQRIRYGQITLPRSVRPGRFDELETDTVNDLLVSVGLEKNPPQKPKPTAYRRPHRRR